MAKQIFSSSVNSDLPIRYSNKALFRQLSNKHILLCCFLYIYLFYIQGEIDHLPKISEKKTLNSFSYCVWFRNTNGSYFVKKYGYTPYF